MTVSDAIPFLNIVVTGVILAMFLMRTDASINDCRKSIDTLGHAIDRAARASLLAILSGPQTTSRQRDEANKILGEFDDKTGD